MKTSIIVLTLCMILLCFITLYIVSNINYLPYFNEVQLNNILTVSLVMIIAFLLIIIAKIVK